MPILAQVASDWWAPLTGTGVAGVMLYWATRFIDGAMKSMEVRLKAVEDSNRLIPEELREIITSLERSVDRMAKSALLQVLSYEQHESTIKAQAKAMISEIDSKAGNR